MSLISRKFAAMVLVGAAAVLGTTGSALAQQQGPFGGDAACNTLRPGTTGVTCTLRRPEGTRMFLLDVPASFRPGAGAMVVDHHGFGDTNGNGERRSSSFRTFASQNGIIFVLPFGLDASWNTLGQCCGQSNARNIDDIGFIKDMTTKLAQIARLDRDMVVATGLSNGGFLSDSLACKAADVFSASIPVSGGLAGANPEAIRANCAPQMPIDVIEFHAMADNVVPFARGILDSVGAEQSRSIFAQAQSCNAMTTVADRIGNLTCEVNPGCQGGVLSGLCVEAGGNHVLAPTVQGTTVAAEAFKLVNRARAQRGGRLLPGGGTPQVRGNGNGAAPSVTPDPVN